MLRNLLFPLIMLHVYCLTAQKQPASVKVEMTKEQIIAKYLENGAWKVSYFAPEYQLFIDSAIALNPNIAYLYQQKAMPYFKQRKYEAGMVILDKAIALDAAAHIDYRAFMKCIFAKSYKDAITDFEASKKIKGEHNVVMDHSYDFYIGLCHLQLNDFAKALSYFEKSIEYTRQQSGESWVHHLELFYAGVALQELGNYSNAIAYFDKALVHYPRFSDVKYYKALSLYRTGQAEQAKQLFTECRTDLLDGLRSMRITPFMRSIPIRLKSITWVHPM